MTLDTSFLEYCNTLNQFLFSSDDAQHYHLHVLPAVIDYPVYTGNEAMLRRAVKNNALSPRLIGKR
jgi:hypothetical protein